MNKTTKIILVVFLLLTVSVIAAYFIFHRVPVKEVTTSPVSTTISTESVADTLTSVSTEPAASTLASSESPSINNTSWLELPGQWLCDAEHVVTHYAVMEGRQQRNYTILYDEDTYISYWVAYPLCASHTTTGREETWGYDPKVSNSAQTSVAKGYGANIPTENYQKNFYARGHQIPNADRNAVPQMQAQTYYSTNMTPQIQNGFNGGIWAKLEDGVRGAVPADDTLYVITGAAFRKVNENLAAKKITNKNDSKLLPVDRKSTRLNSSHVT